jgi:two-component system response regulator VicR
VRRTEGPDRPPIRVGDLVIDLAGRVVHAGGREVHVTGKEFMLLEILAIEPTRMFTKNALVWMIWMVDYSQAAGRALDSHATRLRRKLDPEGQKYVINTWGIGYRLISG